MNCSIALRLALLFTVGLWHSEASSKLLDAGRAHVCVLDQVGRIWCWGDDRFGQLGNGTGSLPQATPKLINDPSVAGVVFVSVSAGAYHTCALDDGGEAWCWGNDDYGQVGDPDLDATLGGFEFPQRVETLPGRRYKAISAGDFHTCGVEESGSIWCWGWDGSGQLGNDSAFVNSPSPAPVQAEGNTFSTVAAGGEHTCAIDVVGDAWCWGSDGWGQIGNGAGPEMKLPLPGSVLTDHKFVSIDVGTRHTCAVGSGSHAECWGANDYQQLGDRSNGDKRSDVPRLISSQDVPVATAFTTVVAGGNHSCALTASGAVWCWGSDAEDELGDDFDPCCGSGGPSEVLLPSDLRISEIAAGSDVSCMLDVRGMVACTGSRLEGQLGDGEFGFVTQAHNSDPRQYTDVSAGNLHSCAIDLEGQPWCWGFNLAGQLGLGVQASGSGASSPAAVLTAGLPGGTSLFEIAAGGSHTCALDANGVAYCWGHDGAGQLGNGNQQNIRAPRAVRMDSLPTASAFKQIELGDFHSCALTEAGDVWCWGRDDHGQLGNDQQLLGTALPVKVAASITFKRLAVGRDHACAVGALNGEIYCWGKGADGRLARGMDMEDQPVPVPIGAFFNVKFTDVAAGGAHTCAVQEIAGNDTASRLWCWGANYVGQVGRGDTSENVPLPVQVGEVAGSQDNSIGRVALGSAHTCAQRPDGALLDMPLQCWGGNALGELADGTRVDRSLPVLASGLGLGIVLKRFSAGSAHTCALRPDSTLACVGSRENGVLGDGVTHSSPVPVVIPNFVGFASAIFSNGMEDP